MKWAARVTVVVKSAGGERGNAPRRNIAVIMTWVGSLSIQLHGAGGILWYCKTKTTVHKYPYTQAKLDGFAQSSPTCPCSQLSFASTPGQKKKNIYISEHDASSCEWKKGKRTGGVQGK